MEALTFLVNNLGSHHEHHNEGASSGDGSGSDSGHHSGIGSGSDGPNAYIKDLDFKQLREAFRSLDTENLGMLSMAEVKQAFKDASIPSEDVDRIFRTLDTNGDGLINYSEFLAATIDRNKALTM